MVCICQWLDWNTYGPSTSVWAAIWIYNRVISLRMEDTKLSSFSSRSFNVSDNAGFAFKTSLDISDEGRWYWIKEQLLLVSRSSSRGGMKSAAVRSFSKTWRATSGLPNVYATTEGISRRPVIALSQSWWMYSVKYLRAYREWAALHAETSGIQLTQNRNSLSCVRGGPERTWEWLQFLRVQGHLGLAFRACWGLVLAFCALPQMITLNGVWPGSCCSATVLRPSWRLWLRGKWVDLVLGNPFLFPDA